MRNTGTAIQSTHLFLLSFRSALHLAETCLRLTQRHLCRKQAHLLANFSWFLFGFNYRITNILKPYQPTKLSRTTAEIFLKRPGLQASFNNYHVVWMSIICTMFMFLSIFIIEHTCLYYLQTEISINLIGSLGSLFCPSEFKGKHVQGEEGEGGCLQLLHMYTALLFTN